jgi:phosphoribosyl 1,2-cyclic phosphate phosphodiesterase
MTISQNLQVRERLLGMGSADANTIFVAAHFSHNGLLMHEEIEARFAPAGVHVAFDGFEIQV